VVSGGRLILGVDAAQITDVRRRLGDLAAEADDAGRLTLASAEFLTKSMEWIAAQVFPQLTGR
jgi:hypothetical protein